MNELFVVLVIAQILNVLCGILNVVEVITLPIKKLTGWWFIRKVLGLSMHVTIFACLMASITWVYHYG